MKIEEALSQLASRLDELYSDDEIETWFSSPHSLLHGQRPIDLIDRGRSDEVKTLIDQLLTGAYV